MGISAPVLFALSSAPTERNCLSISRWRYDLGRKTIVARSTHLADALFRKEAAIRGNAISFLTWSTFRVSDERSLSCLFISLTFIFLTIHPTPYRIKSAVAFSIWVRTGRNSHPLRNAQRLSRLDCRKRFGRVRYMIWVSLRPAKEAPVAVSAMERFQRNHRQ
jgi:hypothetical protein